jgi:hypothetical protein
VRRVLVTASVVPGSPILVTLMMEALIFSETSVLTRATRRNIPEYDILHSHCRENPKSYIALTGWSLQWRSNVFSVKYELAFHFREILKPYKVNVLFLARELNNTISATVQYLFPFVQVLETFSNCKLSFIRT